MLKKSGLSLCRMDYKFSAHTYFLMRISNLNSVSTENQHEIFMKFGKCPYHNWSRNYVRYCFTVLWPKFDWSLSLWLDNLLISGEVWFNLSSLLSVSNILLWNVYSLCWEVNQHTRSKCCTIFALIFFKPSRGGLHLIGVRTTGSKYMHRAIC